MRFIIDANFSPEYQNTANNFSFKIDIDTVSEFRDSDGIGLFIFAFVLLREYNLLVVVVEEPRNPFLKNTKAFPAFDDLFQEDNFVILELSKPRYVLNYFLLPLSE